MTKKSTSISLLVFGLLFIALGVFLFLAQSGTTVVLVVTALDALFGIALIVGGIRGLKTAAVQNMPFDEIEENERLEDQPEYEAPDENVRQENVADYFSEEEPEEMDQFDLAAREGELRQAARQAAEEAARAKKIATDAINDAKQAEAELRHAEEALASLPPMEQRNAMRQIDALAQVAADKSEIAVRESQKAKLAIKEAREAAELHSRAMDAAADAMAGDDEFADFN